MSYDLELELVCRVGVVSSVKEELAAEWKKKPVTRVVRLGSIGTSEKVRVLTMLSEASFMFTVTDIC